MENKRFIAEALLEIAKNSTTTLIDVAEDKELIETASKLGIVIPSPDLAVIKTIYAEIDKVNRNGVVLPKEAVLKGLPTLIGKQINWEHDGAGRICGYIIDAKIKEDKIEIIGVIFKSLFPEEMEGVVSKFAEKKLAVSFEIWNRNPEDGQSVVHELENGDRSIDPIIFHGCGLLLENNPACPKAIVYKLVAKEIETAEKIVDKIFEDNLICASMAIEEPKCKNCTSCTCEKEVIIVDEIVKIEEQAQERLCLECKQPLKDEETELCAVCKTKKEELNKSSEETQVVVTTVETKIEEKSEVAETKTEETKTEETKEEVVVPVVEVKEEATVITKTETEVQVTEIKEGQDIITTETKTEVVVVNNEGLETEKREEEIKTIVTYTYKQMVEKVQEAKVELQKVIEEKDKEISTLKEELGKNKTELDNRNQEIAELKIPKVEEKKEKIMTVGTVEAQDNYKSIQKRVDEKAFGKQ